MHIGRRRIVARNGLFVIPAARLWRSCRGSSTYSVQAPVWLDSSVVGIVDQAVRLVRRCVATGSLVGKGPARAREPRGSSALEAEQGSASFQTSTPTARTCRDLKARARDLKLDTLKMSEPRPPSRASTDAGANRCSPGWLWRTIMSLKDTCIIGAAPSTPTLESDTTVFRLFDLPRMLGHNIYGFLAHREVGGVVAQEKGVIGAFESVRVLQHLWAFSRTIGQTKNRALSVTQHISVIRDHQIPSRISSLQHNSTQSAQRSSIAHGGRPHEPNDFRYKRVRSDTPSTSLEPSQGIERARGKTRAAGGSPRVVAGCAGCTEVQLRGTAYAHAHRREKHLSDTEDLVTSYTALGQGEEEAPTSLAATASESDSGRSPEEESRTGQLDDSPTKRFPSSPLSPGGRPSFHAPHPPMKELDRHTDRYSAETTKTCTSVFGVLSNNTIIPHKHKHHGDGGPTATDLSALQLSNNCRRWISRFSRQQKIVSSTTKSWLEDFHMMLTWQWTLVLRCPVRLKKTSVPKLHTLANREHRRTMAPPCANWQPSNEVKTKLSKNTMSVCLGCCAAPAPRVPQTRPDGQEKAAELKSCRTLKSAIGLGNEIAEHEGLTIARQSTVTVLRRHVEAPVYFQPQPSTFQPNRHHQVFSPPPSMTPPHSSSGIGHPRNDYHDSTRLRRTPSGQHANQGANLDFHNARTSIQRTLAIRLSMERPCTGIAGKSFERDMQESRPFGYRVNMHWIAWGPDTFSVSLARERNNAYHQNNSINRPPMNDQQPPQTPRAPGMQPDSARMQNKSHNASLLMAESPDETPASPAIMIDEEISDAARGVEQRPIKELRRNHPMKPIKAMFHSAPPDAANLPEQVEVKLPLTWLRRAVERRDQALVLAAALSWAKTKEKSLEVITEGTGWGPPAAPEEPAGQRYDPNYVFAVQAPQAQSVSTGYLAPHERILQAHVNATETKKQDPTNNADSSQNLLSAKKLRKPDSTRFAAGANKISSAVHSFMTRFQNRLCKDNASAFRHPFGSGTKGKTSTPQRFLTGRSRRPTVPTSSSSIRTSARR
ncbi:uncharacterized protein MYCFIDRAFT_180072 [Pseudocercospora fijiensis CIRAD86]|uniref:Uncharacterized protein n=1 Tax=Pseudocercospora fijiensis (strain CIRAD86) TaxID=383855 RepID=M2YH89_PSEFD|nr:uncharacterized protein MYCFIDRAFT_180072 [Pseudocercospora fijiensis CIRAD86]EME77195.1 hypothetical protein MYCFIDRAFT_180072 [Pseudocercospora fijiensis CIRAD86]